METIEAVNNLDSVMNGYFGAGAGAGAGGVGVEGVLLGPGSPVGNTAGIVADRNILNLNNNSHRPASSAAPSPVPSQLSSHHFPDQIPHPFSPKDFADLDYGLLKFNNSQPPQHLQQQQQQQPHFSPFHIPPHQHHAHQVSSPPPYQV